MGKSQTCRSVFLSGHSLRGFQSDRWQRNLNARSLWMKTCFLLENKNKIKKKTSVDKPRVLMKVVHPFEGSLWFSWVFCKSACSPGRLIGGLSHEERGNPWGIFKVTVKVRWQLKKHFMLYWTVVKKCVLWPEWTLGASEFDVSTPALVFRCS